MTSHMTADDLCSSYRGLAANAQESLDCIRDKAAAARDAIRARAAAARAAIDVAEAKLQQKVDADEARLCAELETVLVCADARLEELQSVDASKFTSCFPVDFQTLLPLILYRSVDLGGADLLTNPLGQVLSTPRFSYKDRVDWKRRKLRLIVKDIHDFALSRKVLDVTLRALRVYCLDHARDNAEFRARVEKNEWIMHEAPLLAVCSVCFDELEHAVDIEFEKFPHWGLQVVCCFDGRLDRRTFFRKHKVWRDETKVCFVAHAQTRTASEPCT